MPGQPGVSTRRRLDAARVVEAGGAVASQLLHPELTPFEQLYRRLPEEGMFSPSVSPERPFAFELGAFQVPARMALLLFDLRPDIYRFSGVDPGDYVPIERRRFGSLMGFDITVDQQHMGNIAFELDPVYSADRLQAFGSSNAAADGQRKPACRGVVQPARERGGSGNALQPQRPERYGALSIPFTLYARSQQTIQTRCVIFRPIPAPIAFIEYDIAGLLIPEYWLDQLLTAVKPVQEERAEHIR
jgi:hypothetical protein